MSPLCRKMEKSKRERDHLRHAKFLRADENVQSWQLWGNSFKENIVKDYAHRKNEMETYNKKRVNKLEKEKPKEDPRILSLDKSRLYDLYLKPFLTPKRHKEPSPEMEKEKKTKKEKVRHKKSRKTDERISSPTYNKEVPSFHNNWASSQHNTIKKKDHHGREKKNKKSEKSRRHSRSYSRSTETPKMSVAIKQQMKIQPSFHSKNSNEQHNYINEAGGKAFVIYHRQKGMNYLHPHDGYRFEQIAFEKSCETTLDTVQSKRSLSEPRKNSVKELYVAKRRTRIQMEPHKMASTQSDFHSAFDYLKQSGGSVEFEGIRTLFCKTPLPARCLKKKKTSEGTVVTTKSKSTTCVNTWTDQLQETAKKKLDLHKEMMRADKSDRMKFWESIERSLNYRVALAEMFSSQSFMSTKESSRLISSADNSNRGTNIYVRESVISSYQGFSRIITSNKTESVNDLPSEVMTDFGVMDIKPSGSTYRAMKTFVDTIVLKKQHEEEEEEEEEEQEEEEEEEEGEEEEEEEGEEEEEEEGEEEEEEEEEEVEELEEEILMRRQVADSCTSRSSSSISNIHVDPSVLCNKTGFLFEYKSSGRLSLMESTLEIRHMDKELEELMGKLSEEIKRCTSFLSGIQLEKKKQPGLQTVSEGHISVKKPDPKKKKEEDEKPSMKSVFVSTSELKLDLTKPDEEKRNKHASVTTEDKLTETDPSITLTTSSEEEPRKPKTEEKPVQVPPEGNLLEQNSLDDLKPRRSNTKKNPFELPNPIIVGMSLVQENPPTTTSHPAKRSKSATPVTDSNHSIFSFDREPSTYEKLKKSKTRTKLDDLNCCEECDILRTKIIRLERDLVKLEKKMPLYPKEYQETIKDCLENLKLTTDAFLRRLQSCAKIRKSEAEGKSKRRECGKDTRRSHSAPHPVVHKFKRETVNLRPSMSDCELNVEMEILMENVDPVTGKRLDPEPSSGEFEQTGNIQCRVLQNGKEPLLVLDTGFKYSPEKGMLFGKDGEKSSRDIMLPLPLKGSESKTGPSHVTFSCKTPSNFSSEVEGREQSDSRLARDLEMKPLLKNWPSKCRSGESVTKSEDSMGCLVEKKMSVSGDRRRTVCFARRYPLGCSLIPIRKKPTPSYGTLRRDSPSRNSSASTSTVTIFPLQYPILPSFSGVKNPAKHENPTKKKSTKSTEEFSVREKSTQTYQPEQHHSNSKHKCAAWNLPRPPVRHHGVQTSLKKRNEKVQTRMPESEPQVNLPTTEVRPAVLANAAMQVDVPLQAPTSSVGLQIELPSDDALKYIRDLEIQKKVNLAIAELCFHISQEK